MITKEHKVLVLNETEVAALLPMREAVRVMESALATLARGEAVQPLRTIMATSGGAGLMALMPAHLQSPAALGLKAVTIFPNNAERGLDTHLGAVLLLEADTGRVLALINGGTITTIRTAAVSAVATAHLAHEHAADLAILGSGVQARSHFEAMLCVRQIERARVWSRTSSHAQTFADEMTARHALQVTAVERPESAVRDAQIIITVTASDTPVVCGEWLAPGAHLNIVGGCRPAVREVDTSAILRSKVIVDSIESALAEAGELLIPISEGACSPQHIHATLGEIITRTKSGRVSANEITLFKSLGLGIEDLAAAHFVYTRAQTEGRGLSVPF
jgi:ornithine cyclodeaminase